MNEKKKEGKQKKKKRNKTFLIVAQVHLGFLPPASLLGVSPSHSLAHYACNNNGNRLGQTFFLNSRQVAASGALLLLLLPGWLPATWDSGPRRLHVCNLDTQLCPVTCFICCLLLICVTSSPPLLILHSPCCRRNRRTLMNNSLRSGSTYPYRCASPLKFPPSSVCTCHLHFKWKCLLIEY